ncbi:alpha/beta fold hydrolase [Chondromyces apiculatus]|nr:alpha/beta hydrolase [Chondromyces apiculatus]
MLIEKRIGRGGSFLGLIAWLTVAACAGAPAAPEQGGEGARTAGAQESPVAQGAAAAAGDGSREAGPATTGAAPAPGEGAAGTGAAPAAKGGAAGPGAMAGLRRLSVRTPDGLSLAAQEVGPADAPAIVLVHGLGLTHLAWMRQIEGALATKFRLITYDLRGHGASDRPREEAAYTEGRRWGDDLAAVIAAAKVRRPVIVGWSLGGVVMINYLRDHGDKGIAGAVFVDAVTAFKPEFFTKENEGFMRSLVVKDDAARAEGSRRFLDACFAVPPPAANLARVRAAAGVLPAEVTEAIRNMSTPRGDETLRGLRVPTLVMQGDADRMLTVAMGEHTAKLVPGAKLLVYPGLGHAPFVDDATHFDADLEAFVRFVAK